MSNRQIAISVSLISTLLVLAYYLVRVIPMLQQEEINSEDIFRIWAVVIIASIILNIAGNILSMIVLNIVHAIKTQSNKEVRLVDDERDKLIELKGVRITYYVSSIGVLLSMLSFVLGQPALVMFSLLIFFFLVAEIIGDLSQLYFYHRGA
jgi:hypothetical protein